MQTSSIEAVAAIRAQLWDSGFRPVPVLNSDKAPLGRDWGNAARKDPPDGVRFQPVPHALNTGVLADGLRAIDIDIDDTDLAVRCRSIVVGRFGEAPIRMRANSPRCLVLYRAAAGQPAKAVLAGRLGKVEVLGRGQQFVAFGLHPSGVALEWFPEAPGIELVENLPAVTEEGIAALFAELAPLLEAEAPARANGHDRAHEAAEPQAEFLRVAKALADLPNAGPADWEWWNRVGMATWAATAGSAAGGELFDAWSARHPAYDQAATGARWRHYPSSPPTSIGAGTLFHLAREARARSALSDADDANCPADAAEPPSDGRDDPGWFRSLERSLLDEPHASESDGEAAAGEEAAGLDGGIIVPARDWTAPAPLREWLVDGWIPRGYVTGLYGDGAVGKSLLVQQLLTSVACSLPWIGMNVKGGRAVGFMCEDDGNELHRRQEGINRAYGLEMQHLEFLRLSARLGFDNLLMTFDDRNRGEPTELFAQIAKFLTQFPPVLVSLDTLADVFGGNEINRTHARQFVQGIGGQIARQFNCAVVICAHPSVAGMASGSGAGGSTAWSNTFRSRLYMTRPEGDGEKEKDTRSLSRMKANYAPAGGEIILRWQNGALIEQDKGPSSRVEWKHIYAIFDEIDIKWQAGDPWSNAPQTRRDGRFLPLWASVHLGLNERLVAKHIDDWLAGGFLKVAIVSTDSKLRGLRVIKRLHPEVV